MKLSENHQQKKQFPIVKSPIDTGIFDWYPFSARQKGGIVMFVRQTIIHTAIDKIDAASKLFEESVIPAFRSQKGYQGASFISDRKTGKSICASFWESEQDAIANEQSFVYQEQLVKFMSLFTMDPIREGYELLVQDEK